MRLLTGVVLAVALFSPAVFSQQVSLTLAPGTGSPGSSLTLDLTVTSDKILPAGLQWTLTYWAVDFVAVAVAPGPAAVAAGKTLWCTGGAGVSTCLLTGINDNTIQNGVVAKVVVQLSPTTTDMVSALRLANPVAAAADGSSIPATASVAVVTIAQPPRLKGISCTPHNVITPGAAACTVLVSAAAPAGGLTVSLSSSSPNVTLPSSVTVPAGATSAAFNIAVSQVNATTVAGIQAKLGGGTLAGSVILAAPDAAVSVVGVFNAASYASGSVAPGEIVTIFGSGMGPSEGAGMQVVSGMAATAVAGTRVLFDGVAAPLLYVRSDQINTVVPYRVAGHASTQMQVEYQGMLSAATTLPVAATSPGVFTLDSSGSGQGAILNQDGTVNSAANPAPAGSIIVIFGNGQGPTRPAATDGRIITASSPDQLPKPVNAVTAQIGGAAADVLYAGAAPELIAGVLQVNARIPKGIATGPAVPLTVAAGPASMPPGVTVAIQ